MGRFAKSHLVETAAWLFVVALFFGFSFEFNQPIEIYRFGATAWPRTILALLAAVVMGNLYFSHVHGSAARMGRVAMAQGEDARTDYRDISTAMKVGGVLVVPFVFAWLLKPVGFYAGAPFFIAAIMWLFGERRWRMILGMTSIVYLILLILFVFVLNAPLPQGNVSPFYDFSALVLRTSTLVREAL